MDGSLGGVGRTRCSEVMVLLSQKTTAVDCERSQDPELHLTGLPRLTLTAVARFETDLKHAQRIVCAKSSCATRQRRSTMRRFANMNNAAKLAIAATAVMVAVVGITLLWPSASASATAQPGSSPTAVSVGVASDSLVAAACAPVASLMCASRLTVTENGVRFSFRVPTRRPGGWERFSSISTDKSAGGPISLNKSIVGPQGAEAIIYWTSFPQGDYANPCVRLLSPSIGASAAKLATAVSRARGTKLVKGPSDVTLGGRPAKHVVLTVRKSVGCDPGFSNA